MAEIQKQPVSDKILQRVLSDDNYQTINNLLLNPNVDFFARVDRHTMYEVIRDMLVDDQISSDLQTFKSFIEAENYDVRLPTQYQDDPISIDYQDEYKNYLEYKGERLFTQTKKLLDSLDFGNIVCEVAWEEPEINDGQWFVEKLVPLNPQRYGFTTDGKPFDTTKNKVLDKPYKYIYMTHDQSSNNPFGRSVLRRTYWPWKFKKEAIKANILYVKKSILPSIVALMEASANRQDTITRAENISDQLRQLSNSSGIAMANVESIETIQATSKGEELISIVELFDRMISKSILGSSTVTNDTKYGNKSANEIQVEIIEKRAKSIATSELQPPVNTLLQWHLILNRSMVSPEKRPYLTYSYRYDPTYEQVIQAQEAGLSFSKSWFFDKYGLQPPTDTDDESVSGVVLNSSIENQDNDFFLRQKHQRNRQLKTSAIYTRIQNRG